MVMNFRRSIVSLAIFVYLATSIVLYLIVNDSRVRKPSVRPLVTFASLAMRYERVKFFFSPLAV